MQCHEETTFSGDAIRYEKFLYGYAARCRYRMKGCGEDLLYSQREAGLRVQGLLLQIWYIQHIRFGFLLPLGYLLQRPSQLQRYSNTLLYYKPSVTWEIKEKALGINCTRLADLLKPRGSRVTAENSWLDTLQLLHSSSFSLPIQTNYPAFFIHLLPHNQLLDSAPKSKSTCQLVLFSSYAQYRPSNFPSNGRNPFEE